MAFGMKKAGGGGGLNLAKAAMASKLVRFSTQFLKKLYIFVQIFFSSLYFSTLNTNLIFYKIKSYTLDFVQIQICLWAGSPR